MWNRDLEKIVRTASPHSSLRSITSKVTLMGRYSVGKQYPSVLFKKIDFGKGKKATEASPRLKRGRRTIASVRSARTISF